MGAPSSASGYSFTIPASSLFFWAFYSDIYYTFIYSFTPSSATPYPPGRQSVGGSSFTPAPPPTANSGRKGKAKGRGQERAGVGGRAGGQSQEAQRELQQRATSSAEANCAKPNPKFIYIITRTSPPLHFPHPTIRPSRSPLTPPPRLFSHFSPVISSSFLIQTCAVSKSILFSGRIRIKMYREEVRTIWGSQEGLGEAASQLLSGLQNQTYQQSTSKRSHRALISPAALCIYPGKAVLVACTPQLQPNLRKIQEKLKWNKDHYFELHVSLPQSKCRTSVSQRRRHFCGGQVTLGQERLIVGYGWSSNYRQRERFHVMRDQHGMMGVLQCQQSMLAQESSRETEPQQSLTVTAVTWNLFASVPPLQSLLDLANALPFCPPPDLILLATQECQRSLLLSLCCEDKEDWEEMIVSVFTEHVLVATQVMRGLHTAILVRKPLRNYFMLDGQGRVKAGARGLMGNKGAISLSFRILGEPFQVINCHLHSQHTNTTARNETITRILHELVGENPTGEVIFLGDFNYRIDMGKEQYRRLHGGKYKNTEDQVHYSAYLKREQLTNQNTLQLNFLRRFEEGRISFPPTYKLDPQKNQYSRARVPGWTDRIFSLKRLGEGSMIREVYSCEYGVKGCDHRPVLARFRKPISKGTANFNSRYNRQREAHSSCALI